MAIHNVFGKQGEALAVQYLVDHQYHILHTNWRFGKLEADIVAQKNDIVIFVEVKTRASIEYGEPELFVDEKKQKNYIRLANHYMIQFKRHEEARFDIISVVLNPAEGVKITHFENAFTFLG